MLAARIRAFEKRLQEHMHEITVPVHLSLGHEQVAVEIAEHFRKGDWWFSTHRNHHHYIAAGGSEQKLWDEIMGLGTAYAIKGSGSMVVCSTGDAGTEAGVFWESLNFAALYELPIAFIVENNGMSVDSPIRDRQATPISTRAEAFGIDVFDDVDGAMKMARAGIPSLCERKVTLLADHINMGRLPPSKVI
jgi:TPP-dependent pyruvate/acetoin dehydrogenase alpha subunit